MPDTYAVVPYFTGDMACGSNVRVRDYTVGRSDGLRPVLKLKLDFVTATELVEELNAAARGDYR